MDQTHGPVTRIVTPVVAKINFRELIERVRSGNLYIIGSSWKKPEAVLLSFEDYSRLAGVGPDWAEQVHKTNLQR